MYPYIWSVYLTLLFFDEYPGIGVVSIIRRVLFVSSITGSRLFIPPSALFNPVHILEINSYTLTFPFSSAFKHSDIKLKFK